MVRHLANVYLPGPLALIFKIKPRQMDQNKKFFSQRAITIATYFGGPLAAGYLVKKNYETIDQPENANKALIIGIVSTILVFAGVFSIPDPILDKIPNALIPLIYTGIIYLIVERVHGKMLRTHKETGGEFYTGWKAAGIGAIAMLIIVSGIAITAFLSGDLNSANMDFDNKAYDKGVAEFLENENIAIAVFNEMETKTPKNLIQEFSNGKDLWQRNLEIIQNLSQIENLPPELKNQDEILIKYCKLRITHHELIIKAIQEDTDKYAQEIKKTGLEITKVLDELN